MSRLYLVHFERPYPRGHNGGVQHYLGFTTEQLHDRLREHIEGRGSPLLLAATLAGIRWSIVRSWPDRGRVDERRLKKQRNLKLFCPVCTPDTYLVPRRRLASIL